MGKAAYDLAQAVEHHRAGRLDQASKIYTRILARDPDHADALHLLGLISCQGGDAASGIEMIRRAIRQNPADPVYHDNLGKILQALGRPQEAAACFEEVLRRRPADADAWVNLGNNCYRSGLVEKSLECFHRAVESRPECVEACINLGHVLSAMNRPGEAIEFLRRAMELKPDRLEAVLNLAVVLQERGDYDESAALCEQAIRLQPDSPEAHHNLGVVRRQQGRLTDAAACYREALRLKSDYAETHSSLGVVLVEQGETDQAAAAFREALRVAPGFWVAQSNLLLCLNYSERTDPVTLFAEHRRWEELFAGPMAMLRQPRANSPDPDRRLRIGYVSPDFRTHPVAFFFGPILAGHDRRHVSCFCYSNAARPDGVTERLRSLADAWRDIRGKTDEQVLEMIREDSIDILVDLAGHTSDNRLRLFAAKPAPIQVSYLGYPNTTGLTAIDYRITDAWADPPGQTERYHTEELVRLPSGFLCYQPLADAPAVSELPCLAAGVFTFGSFNNVAKISPAAVSAWAAILKAVPNSRLLLKANALMDDGTQQRLLRLFAEHGIGPERVHLLRPVSGVIAHLEAYSQVDLALDTFPYNGTTTTCEALWMGVPVVTVVGETHAARVGLSLLSQLGLTDFIARSPEEYVELAARISQDRDRLRELRATLRDTVWHSSLTDPGRLVRELEQAYREMWRRWCERQRPAAKASTPAASLSADDLRQRVESIPFWYHRVELPGGIVTPGWAPVNKDAYRIPASFAGKRVLDIGAWDGFWTFEALKRGAREVVAIDDFSDLLGQLDSSQRHGWETFDLCRAAFGYAEDRCRRLDLSVYDATEERLGRFDVIFFFGTLYHLRHPLLAFDRLAAICDGDIYVESAILDDYSPYRGGLGHGYPDGQMVMEFYPASEYGDNPSNWWAPTLHCLGHMVRAAGFPSVQVWKLTDKAPAHLAVCRGFAHGSKTGGTEPVT